MKTYHKSELAEMADVSYSTFYRFLKNRRTELDAMGINPNAQTFRGDGLKYICKEYNINHGGGHDKPQNDFDNMHDCPEHRLFLADDADDSLNDIVDSSDGQGDEILVPVLVY